MKFYIECKKSDKKDFVYHMLMCDMGTHVISLSMEKDVIADFADIKISELFTMKPGDTRTLKITCTRN